MLTQDSSEQLHKHLLHCKEVWNDFLIVLDIIRMMGTECDENKEVNMIHFRVLGKMTDKFKFNDLEELANDLVEK